MAFSPGTDFGEEFCRLILSSILQRNNAIEVRIRVLYAIPPVLNRRDASAA
jgi:hypothetical protein